MQGLLDAPRNDGILTTVDITNLLQNNLSSQVEYGAQWLGPQLQNKGDVSSYMSEGSTIDYDNTATILGSCSLNFDSDCPVNYITDFVKPYMILKDPNSDLQAQFNLGVYSLSSPTYDNSTDPSVLTLTGYDLLYYLNQTPSDSIQFIAGANPVESAVEVIGLAFTGAVVEYTDTTSVLAVDMSWPLGQSDPYSSNGAVTYLSIVNDLLAAAGYFPVWVDWNGTFQMQPWTAPLSRAAEWPFDLSVSNNLVAEQRTSYQDIYDVPNYWRFIMQNLDGPPVEGVSQFTYIDESPNNPSSYYNRQRFHNSINFVTATDYGSLYNAGLQQIISDLAPGEQFNLSTPPFPLAWHLDRISLYDPHLANIAPLYSPLRQTMCVSWKLPLDGQSDMQWVLQTVNM